MAKADATVTGRLVNLYSVEPDGQLTTPIYVRGIGR
jgi:hypothetical protein